MSLLMSSIYWSRVRIFLQNNWKYGTICICGSIVSGICTFSFTKYITGKGIIELLFNIFLKREQSKYRNIINYTGFSIQFGIRPSTELIAFDSMIRSMSVKTNQTEYNKIMSQQQKINIVKSRRKEVKIWITNMFPLPSYIPNPEKISINNQLNAYILKYPGCSINNGLIFYIHGGGLYAGEPAFGYPMLCIMQQYLQCYSFSIDYHLCPEISLIQQIEECIQAYKYILNKMNINSKKIFIVGDSAGACLCLLFLQKLNRLKLAQPCGGVMISPDVDLTCKIAMKTESDEGINDAMIDNYMERQLYTLCIDENDKKEYNDDDFILSLDKYCPLNGVWTGLCPLYINASLNEVLINNSKEIVNKCKEFNVDVEYKWNKYLLHTGPLMCDYIPESRDTLIVIIEWMKKLLYKQMS